MKTYTFMLTVAMGKRLIAKGLMAEPQVQKAMMENRLLIVAGTTNAYIAEEALKAIGDETKIDTRVFHRGITVAPGAKVEPGQTEFDLLIDHGKACFDRTVFEIAPELGKDDMIMKGANALYMPSHEAAVLVGHPQAGTMIPIVTAAVGRRVQLVVPVGVEKRVEKPIAELVSITNAPDCNGCRLFPIPGETYTELDALMVLTGADCVDIVSAGGAVGAEGGVYYAVQGDEDSIDRTKELVRELSTEPAQVL